jgi:tetratricopeptide (TPR) repeat protein
MKQPQEISLSPWILGRNSAVLRQPGRHPCLRHADFEDKYDFQTVFYDCFWSDDGRSVFLIGPALLNLEQDLGMRFFAMPSEEECWPNVIPRTQVTLLSVAVPPSLKCLRIESTAGTTYLAPQPNHCPLLAGRRVLMTLSQNNELEWIRDWVIFHQRLHGCDAVLVYDNNSTKYDISELRACLSGIAGVNAVAISWPYLYGPFDGRFPLTYELWHGHFCQFGMMEHARWRFLSSARCILNVDVDELIVCENRKSIFALAEESSKGYLKFFGKWVETLRSAGGDTSAIPLHRDFWHIRNRGAEGCESKWVAVPDRVPRSAQLFVHEILGYSEAELPVQAQMRHYKALNVNWTVDTPGVLTERTRAAMDVGDLEADADLQEHLDTAFRDVPRTLEATPDGHKAVSAYRWRLRSAALKKAGRLRAAEDALETAISEAPGWPSLRLYLAQLAEARGETASALDLKSPARHLVDPAAETHFCQEQYLLHTGEYGGAARSFRRSLEIDNGFVPAYYALARLYWSSGRPRAAERILRRGLGRASTSSLLHYGVAEVLSSMGHHGEALRYANTAGDLNRQDSRIETLRARAFLALGQAGDGCKAARRAIEIQSDNSLLLKQFSDAIEQPFSHPYPELYSSGARAVLVDCLLQMGMEDEALEESGRLLKCHPSIPAAHESSYRALRERGDDQPAHLALQKAIKLAYWDFERPPPRTLGRFREREWFEDRVSDLQRLLLLAGRPDEAMAVLKTAQRLHPDIHRTWFLLSAQLREAGKTEELREHLAGAVKVFPRHPDLWREYGQVLAEGGDTQYAIVSFQKALRLGAQQTWLKTELARMLIESDSWAEAEALIRGLLESDSENGVVHFCLSETFRKQGRIHEAIEPCRKAASLLADEAWIWSHLGDLLIQTKLPDEAEASLKLAERLKPDDMLTQFRIGRVHEERGEMIEALDRMSRAVAIDSSQGWLWRHYANLLKVAGEAGKAAAALRKADKADSTVSGSEAAGRKPKAARRRRAV